MRILVKDRTGHLRGTPWVAAESDDLVIRKFVITFFFGIGGSREDSPVGGDGLPLPELVSKVRYQLHIACMVNFSCHKGSMINGHINSGKLFYFVL